MISCLCRCEFTEGPRVHLRKILLHHTIICNSCKRMYLMNQLLRDIRYDTIKTCFFIISPFLNRKQFHLFSGLRPAEIVGAALKTTARFNLETKKIFLAPVSAVTISTHNNLISRNTVTISTTTFI